MAVAPGSAPFPGRTLARAWTGAPAIEPEEIPETLDCPNCGLPAGRDKENPPSVVKVEPYKTHLAYVKERRTEEEAETLLDEALEQLRARRGRLTPQ